MPFVFTAGYVAIVLSAPPRYPLSFDPGVLVQAWKRHVERAHSRRVHQCSPRSLVALAGSDTNRS